MTFTATLFHSSSCARQEKGSIKSNDGSFNAVGSNKLAFHSAYKALFSYYSCNEDNLQFNSGMRVFDTPSSYFSGNIIIPKDIDGILHREQVTRACMEKSNSNS